MTLSELQRALTSVEPAAVLAPPRVMERVIRQVLQLTGLVWDVPHRHSWIVDRTLLFRHVEQSDLALAPDQILPATVILLSWPEEEELQRGQRSAILLRTWRQLFHATIHQAMERCWEHGQLTPAKLREHIEALGATAFEEIQAVLSQENILPADSPPRAVYNEFVAVFLELHFFSPTLLPAFFPGLRNIDAVRELINRDIEVDAVLRDTRLPGAPDPQSDTTHRISEANEYFHELDVRSKAAFSRGNMVEAAIELQRAVRVAPADKAPHTRHRAEAILQKLLERLTSALELSEEERLGWSRLLPILLEKADQGSRPAEAALLFELQKICVDHEREVYKLDIGQWLLSLGRRPVQRPLPSQRLVHITRTLRSALPSLAAARLSDEDRGDLEKLLNISVERGEERVRQRFRPMLTSALQDVGLTSRNPLEVTSFAKMVEEILDKIITYGFVTFSDLRDTISRNQLKLPDLTDPHDFIRGDPLIRLDRRLAAVLDGVYRPGEFYLRWLERFTALNFGTRLGRLITQFVTMPIGGAWLILEAILLIPRFIHRHGTPPADTLPGPDGIAIPIHEPDPDFISLPVYVSLWIFFGVLLFGLIHSAPMRERLYQAWVGIRRSLRKAFFEVPVWFARRYGLDRVLSSWAFQLVYHYLFKPALLTLAARIFLNDLLSTWQNFLIAFLIANFVVNSHPGEVIWEALLKTLTKFYLLLRAGLIPALFRAIVLVYKQLLHALEGALFGIDEWLRFRGGESKYEMAIRSVVTVIWAPISYLIRFNLVVFIEPTLHPLKFPICSIAFKFTAPFILANRAAILDLLTPVVGTVVAEAIYLYVFFFTADVFGFIFWELKENWSLFRANRRQTVAPVQIGSHGETVRRLFQPGFHSGTLPRLFGRIRHAETRAMVSGNYSAVRQYRSSLKEVEVSLARFFTREFSVLLDQSPPWRGQALRVEKVELSSNQIRYFMRHPQHEGDPLVMSIENRTGWLVAGVNQPSWLTGLSPTAHAALHNVVIRFYKLCNVDLIREQIRSLLSPGDHFDFIAQGLMIWPSDRQGKAVSVDLRPHDDVRAVEAEGVESNVAWDLDNAVFGERRLLRSDCLASWPAASDSEHPPYLLMADVPVLPSPQFKEAGEESAA